MPPQIQAGKMCWVGSQSQREDIVQFHIALFLFWDGIDSGWLELIYIPAGSKGTIAQQQPACNELIHHFNQALNMKK
ncbi:hypothetical protein QQP08_023905 [Theobroma cacao]|uniref:Uncharacterized protein n=1 Tax=Theobroma cacao TaxID=3641 RepID=A0A061FBT1_THECC|nr:Uncharacterized protein TCM_034056 [Theobroma cacao]WRX31418.1 hypothetical protein QQP08_023905 [Theobroma cacao]